MQITPLNRYKQIQPEERVTLASLHFQNFTVCEIARKLGHAPSTITKELSRNSCYGVYASKSAEACAVKRRMQARTGPKLHKESILFDIVHHLLCIRWSPEQISMTLSATYPKSHEYRVSHETIYNCIYAQPVGELKRDLIKALRQAHNKGVHLSNGQDRRGQIPDMVSFHVRPPEIEDRQFPGHWEGDLIKGEANGSALCTLVERTSRLLMLVKLPKVKPASALNVLQGFTDKARTPYEFGVKVTVATTLKEGLVVGMRSMPGNPWDGHTLDETIEQVSILTNIKPKTVIVDKGYQGVKIEGVEILRSGQRRVTRAMKAMIKRRSAIEPAIGHMKMDGKLSRNPLKGALGDALHAVMCGAGHNMRMLLRKLRLLCAQFGIALQEVLQVISPSQRTNDGGVA